MTNRKARLKKLERKNPEEPVFTSQILLELQAEIEAEIKSGKRKAEAKPFDLEEIQREIMKRDT